MIKIKTISDIFEEEDRKYQNNPRRKKIVEDIANNSMKHFDNIDIKDRFNGKRRY